MATPSPAAAPESSTFRYDFLDRSGEVNEPGSYAFLKADGTPIATYEGLRSGWVATLRIHETDADGVSRAAFYDGVAAGDVFEWREHETCWIRYIVDEASAPVAGTRTLAVRWLAYAYAGCSGDLTADGSWTHRWSPPNLSHPDFTTAIRFGPFFLYQPGWEGEYPDYERTAALYGEPGEEREGRILSNDLATVRQHPLWREPDVPDGWTLTEATAGMDGQYGYWAHYAPPGGGYGVNVVIRYIDYLPIREPSSSIASSLTQEMRLIDGRPAVVEYSPEGSGNPSSPYVAIYDEATGILYEAFAQELSLRRAGAEGMIAILRSLIPPPGTFGATGGAAEPGWVGGARGDVAAVLGAGDRDAAGEALRRSETPFSDEARAYLLELHAALNARTSPDERSIAVETVNFSNLGSGDGGRAVILTVGAASGGLPLPGGGVAAGALARCLVEEGGAVEVRLPAPLSACRME